MAHLEGNGVVVLAGINFLGNAAVGAIGSDDRVHLDGLGLADLAALLVAVEVHGVLALWPILQAISHTSTYGCSAARCSHPLAALASLQAHTLISPAAALRESDKVTMLLTLGTRIVRGPTGAMVDTNATNAKYAT